LVSSSRSRSSKLARCGLIISSIHAREDKQLAWTSDCLFPRTKCCLCARFSL